MYYTPFVRLEHGDIRSKDLRDIRPEFNKGVNVIPQVIASGQKEFSAITDKIIEYGYKHIDINMGCPFPLQTRHGKGAGLLMHPDKVEEIISATAHYPDITFSLKMRLGYDSEHQWKSILPILNAAHLHHITIHPRIGTQQYKGNLYLNEFDELLSASQHPVIFNGEISSIDDIIQLEKTYGDSITGVMIGRGLLARPSLGADYKDGTVIDDRALITKIKDLHNRLYEHYSSIIPGEAQQLNKLRTFWDYIEPTIGRKQWKKIMKAGNAKNYFAAVADL